MYKFILALGKGLQSAFQMISWRPGGGRAGENVHVVWQVPPSPADRDENKVFRLRTECLNDIPIYHTRVKKATFLAIVVHPSFIDSKAAA